MPLNFIINLITLYKIRSATNPTENYNITNLREFYKDEYQAFLVKNPSLNKKMELINKLRNEIYCFNEQRISCELSLSSLYQDSNNWTMCNTIVFERFYESLIDHYNINIRNNMNEIKRMEEDIDKQFLQYLQNAAIIVI